MKVSIIGGGGLVGSSAGFALQCGGVVREIALLDVNLDLATGQALDLLHGGPSTADQIIVAGGYEHVPSSDVVCITAGLRRKPDESRLDLINRNTDLFLSILTEVAKAGVKKDAIVLVVSNPVDILTYVAADRLDLPLNQVLGLGTQLDTIRFRSLIAQELKAAPSQVNALILGEHGDSMVPIWSSATVGGVSLLKFPNFNATLQQKLFERTKNSGAECLKTKGGAGWAVGLSIVEVIHAIALDQPQILPVSTQLTGEYDIRNTCLSVPTTIGKSGVIKRHEIELWPREYSGMLASAKALDATYAQVK